MEGMVDSANLPAPLMATKEAYRLWFEYLKVALRSNDPQVMAALETSRAFYAPWEMDRADAFNPWWAEKKTLFLDQARVRVLAPGETPKHDHSLVLEVPLTKSTTRLLGEIKVLLQDARTSPVCEPGRIGGEYPLTVGSEPKLVTVREMLSVYRDVYLKHPQLRGRQLLAKTQEYYRGRRNKKWAKVPLPLMHAPEDMKDVDRAVRTMNRYIEKAGRIVLFVAGGEFPGRYWVKEPKNGKADVDTK